MTTYTDQGREWTASRAIDEDDADPIDTIAVGTGANESEVATNLGNEIYRGFVHYSNTHFDKLAATGQGRGVISLKGGTEVPAGTDITEMALIAGGDGGDDMMVFIDEFDPIPVAGGEQEDFVLGFEFTR